MTTLTKKQKTLLHELMQDCQGDAEALLGKNGLLRQLKKQVVETLLEAELTDHLGYEPHAPCSNGSGNSRNGYGSKTVHSEEGEMSLAIPRDRNGSFQPQIIKKGQRRLVGIDDTIISLYARGLSTRDIQEQLQELYAAEVSATLISHVTNRVLDEVKAWQARPLDAVYPIIYFDCLLVKARTDGSITNQAVYLALGIKLSGEKELLGLWLSRTEGAKLWLNVFTELKNRGVDDCFIACVDGLAGLAEAIETVYPQTQVQLCIVHQVRNSLKYVSWKDRKQVASGLRAIYTAATAEAAQTALAALDEQWSERYPAIVPSWQRQWHRLTPFFDYPPAIRKVIYTTNAIESLNYSLRRVLRGRGAFPNDDAIKKLLYLALQNASRKWTKPIHNWKVALNQFIIRFGERVPV